MSCISIHALLAESDSAGLKSLTSLTVFLSTLSLRRATCTIRQSHCNHQISIHALLAESDYGRAAGIVVRDHFYPRSPCGERPACAVAFKLGQLFLSTLSLRRATIRSAIVYVSKQYFYPRSPCGERRHWQTGQSRTRQFLSTLSLRRATRLLSTNHINHMDFYPRSPCGERLWHCLCNAVFLPISIHALLAESDYYQHTKKWKYGHFYPRSPCGERLMPSCKAISLSRFLSTLSLRRATLTYKSGYASDSISIHALLAESDYRPGPFQLSRTEFLSTLSLRRATRSAPEQLRTVRVFLSTLSLRRATHRREPEQPEHIFLSTLSLRRATIMVSCCSSVSPFLSTLSLRRATLPGGQSLPSQAHFYPRSPCGERQSVC